MVVDSRPGKRRVVAMSTGKRLAKRSIIGTRVCAPAEDGRYYSGVIAAVKTPAAFAENSNCINLTPHTRYSVRFDARPGYGRATVEFLEGDLIGPGFRAVGGLHLRARQKVFVTYKGREVAGDVVEHALDTDEVVIQINGDTPFTLQKRLDEVRLLESRKSARLADIDTDFARLADMATERGKRSHTIDVPAASPNHYSGSRKRRPSNSQDDSNPFMSKDDQMEQCSAALVLMSLSCSPHSSNLSNVTDMSWAGTSPGSSSSASSSFRLSPSPSPSETGYPSVQLSSSSGSDEGIVMDYPEDMPRKKKPISCTSYQCTWKTCMYMTQVEEQMKEHIRTEHLKDKGEEEFYYCDVEEMTKLPPAPPPPPPPPTMMIRQPQPTLSHMDMARPPHEDPEYQRQIVGTFRQQIYSGPIAIPQSPHKLMKLSPRPHSPKMPVSPRRVRGENKKCRKVYGMEHKEQWCTQCKWKKACTRFGD